MTLTREWWYGSGGVVRARRGGRGIVGGSATTRDLRIASGAFIYQSARTMPLDPNSAAKTAFLVSKIRDRYSTYGAIATTDYGLPMYVADATTPRIRVGWNRATAYPGNLGYYDGPRIFENVPWPAEATPSTGTDKSIAIWSPVENRLWEFWLCEPDGAGWKASNGGCVDHVTGWDGIYQPYQGMEVHGIAAAGTGFAPLVVQAGDVAAEITVGGGLDHAVYCALPFEAMAKNSDGTWPLSWPARRTEHQASNTAGTGIAIGQRLRFPATVDIDSWTCHPAAKVIASAIRDHGAVVVDGAGNFTIGCDTDPAWGAILGSTPTYQVFAGVPWEQLELCAVNAGQP